MDNNINFTGTFLIKRPSIEVKQALSEVLGSRKIIYEKFKGGRDVLYVVRDSADKNVANVIQKNHLSFKYYPDLNTGSGFDVNHPDKAAEIIKNAGKNFTTKIEKVLSRLEALQPKKKVKDNPIDRVLGALSFEAEEFESRYKGGYTSLFDQKGHLRIRISPTSKNGFNFVTVFPKYNDEKVLRYAIDSNGQIAWTYGPNSQQFQKSFTEAVEYNKMSKKMD